MEPRQRRPLSGLRGGAIERCGAKATADLLARALDLVAEGGAALELTHGFHSYPARFHPLLVRRLLAESPGARVLDPFVGSGTTLVEAALAGRAGLGVDVNPLAVELARLKATVWPATGRARLAAEGERVTAYAAERVRAARRAGAARERPRAATRYDDPKRYPPHVFRELVTLREAIDATADPALRRVLLLVLSSIVVKVSLQRSDTDERLVERNVPRGAASRHFAARVRELVERMAQLAERAVPGAPPPDVRLGDARRLGHIASGSIDVVVTSPPYLGTYDYARHHARRFGWVGLDPRPMLAGEIGARSGANAGQWARDVASYVAEIARVLRPGATAFVLVGDSVSGGAPVAGDGELRRAAARARLEVVASASQARPDVAVLGSPQLPSPGRREHLLALAKR